MNIITKEQLFETQIVIVLNTMIEEMESRQDKGEIHLLSSLDEFCYENLNLLGETIYELIGNYYGNDIDGIYEDLTKEN